MNIEWEEQQIYFLENLNNEYCRMLLMIHSIPKDRRYHVLTHVYVTPSPEIKELWQQTVEAGAPFPARKMAIATIGAMSQQLGTPHIALGKPWRQTLETEGANHSGFIFVVVICFVEAAHPIEIDFPLAGILESIAVDELRKFPETTFQEEIARIPEILPTVATPRRLGKKETISPMLAHRGRTVYILGAGTSHDYPYSPFGVSPPLARSVFSVYHAMHLSWDLSVRVGDIINYLRDFRGIAPEQFWSFNDNIEDLMTEIDEKLWDVAAKLPHDDAAAVVPQMIRLTRVYDQLIFFLSHVLNETQNGPFCPYHDAFVQQLAPEDTVITLNWDTILDKAFSNRGWDLTDAYGVPFTWILQGNWRRFSTPLMVKPARYLKLHGSVNWLVRYVTRNLQTGERCMIVGGPEHDATTVGFETHVGIPAYGFTVRAGQLYSFRTKPIPHPDEAAAWPLLFINGDKPFRVYQDRYRGGYGQLAYFFPPNDPEDDIPLMPLIIPPTRHKLYDEFPHIFGPLWHNAELAVQSADRIVLIGYSLPPTDHKTVELLQLPGRNGRRPQFQIVGPSPEAVANRLISVAGIPTGDVSLFRGRFGEFCGC